MYRSPNSKYVSIGIKKPLHIINYGQEGREFEYNAVSQRKRNNQSEYTSDEM